MGPALPPATRRPDSEAILIEQARRGCLRSYGELVARHQALVYGFLRWRTGSAEDAEDLSQETFLRAWSRLGRFDPGRRLSAWLLAIARREEASARRRRRRRAVIDARLGTGPQPAGPPAVGEPGVPDEHRALRAAMESLLSPDERAALFLRYAAGLDIAEVATVLGRSRVGTRVLLFRCRERLLAAIQPAATRRPAPRAALTPALLGESAP